MSYSCTCGSRAYAHQDALDARRGAANVKLDAIPLHEPNRLAAGMPMKSLPRKLAISGWMQARRLLAMTSTLVPQASNYVVNPYYAQAATRLSETSVLS